VKHIVKIDLKLMQEAAVDSASIRWYAATMTGEMTFRRHLQS